MSAGNKGRGQRARGGGGGKRGGGGGEGNRTPPPEGTLKIHHRSRFKCRAYDQFTLRRSKRGSRQEQPPLPLIRRGVCVLTPIGGLRRGPG